MSYFRDRAACRDTDPELFFPVGESGPALQQTRTAQAVCAGCPVATNCLQWALEHGVDHGVFGGVTADERRALRRTAQEAV